MLIEHVDAIVDMRRNQTLVAERRRARPRRHSRTCARPRRKGAYECRALRLGRGPGGAGGAAGRAGRRAVHRWRRRLRHALSAHAARARQGAQGGERRLRGARRPGDRQRATRRAVSATKRPSRRLHGATSKRSFHIVPAHRDADPHVLHSLRNEYRALGGIYTVHHHTSFLASSTRAVSRASCRENAAASRITTRAISGATTARWTRPASCCR